MNWAGIHRLPLIFVIENNHYAISSPRKNKSPEVSPPEAEGYGSRVSRSTATGRCGCTR